MIKSIKKIIAIGLTTLLSIGVFAGCNNSKNNDKSEVVLRIGAQPYPLYSSIYVAKEMGYLDEEFNKIGEKYEWTDFNSGPLVNEAVASGSEDIGFMADMPAILAKSSGQDIQIIGNVAYGEKALALIVGKDSDITDPSQLKGKKIAYVKGSYAQHLLSLILEKEGLTFNDIESVNLAAGDIGAALDGKQIDGAVIWEQFISKLTSEGRARVLIDGTGIKRGNMVTYSTRKFEEEHPEAIEAYIKACQRGSDYIKTNPKEAADAIADKFGVSPELLVKIFNNLTFTQALTDDDINEIKKVEEYTFKEGIIPSEVNIDELINTKLLEDAGIK
ncbi:aliphatic sulfonate ABC transporter substrate-binding protein [Clostridium butyricum]|uniref:ABC transporter, substrate binding protein [nitrate/sulfonate] n=1 Tax=Clostridium butyricum E4 str. BoNT E BL5262 TaxID=632245 RepID=C4IK14_CLOBU|nr:aliphatic sulfonate ABC transporter substrate-binding protein [Clostridium butyricum]APF22089.1 ABC transporter, substrate-binding, aliphatic sulfonates family protein [Clostridium butyricum]EDT76711.1 ABC transporter, substrate binding protein [Clostridium butyricum 5521]EEP54702.1 ABC transporter, substrate binding protein [nitrate/sulfonate] [Clostridium butyricum E4 str. BoNT E BL5262]NFL32097.1 aliphatic sulfonate ABC transporter substrate-binding protein [Clostridium butyricum]NFS1775